MAFREKTFFSFPTQLGVLRHLLVKFQSIELTINHFWILQEVERLAEEDRLRKEEEDQRRMEEEQLRLLEESKKAEEERLLQAIQV